MSDFYVKSATGEFLPVKLESITGKNLNDKLIIVQVGTPDLIATDEDLDQTVESFQKADVIKDMKNSSLIITPYHIDILPISNEELEQKALCVQVGSNDDRRTLNEQEESAYQTLSREFRNVVISTTISVGEYKQIKETLERCEIRRKRRATARE